MSQSKVHSSSSSQGGNVPFAWEKQPGISKGKHPSDIALVPFNKLPPPPCQLDPTSSPKVWQQVVHVPLPPCAFPAALRATSGKAEDDPFLAAYKECTKQQPRKLSRNASKKRVGVGGGSWLSGGGLFSCKHSCDVSVREDSLLRLSSNSPPPVPRESLDLDEKRCFY